MKIDPTCDQAIRAIEARDFRAWHGLPATCTPDVLAQALHRQGTGAGARQIGSRGRAIRFWPAKVDGYSWPWEVSVDGDVVARLDTKRTQPADGLAAHLAALGEPAAKRPYYNDTVEIPDGQWVWPDRGLALYLSSDHRFVLGVGLFAATDLATYQRELEPRGRMIEEPLR